MALSYSPDITIQQLIEIIVVKQEYLGYESYLSEQYGLYYDKNEDEEENENNEEIFDNIIGKYRFPNGKLVVDCKIESKSVIYLHLLPWKLKIRDSFHNNKKLTIKTNPHSNFDTIIQNLIIVDQQDQQIQILEERTDEEKTYKDDIEYGIFSCIEQVWLTSSTPLTLLKEFQNFGEKQLDLLLTAKVAPLIIQFKEQSFNLEIYSNYISIEEVLSKVTEKLDIPLEHRSRYSLFLDDGQPHEDEPSFGLLESDQTIHDILESNDIECVSCFFFIIM